MLRFVEYILKFPKVDDFIGTKYNYKNGDILIDNEFTTQRNKNYVISEKKKNQSISLD